MFYLSKLLFTMQLYALFLGNSSRNYIGEEEAEIKDVQKSLYV